MTDDKQCTIGIAGLGLIGGSLALAFKAGGFTVKGCDINGGVVSRALAEGAIDEGGTAPDVLFDADYIFVALYPDDIISFVESNAASFKKGSVTVDCCGVKGYICNELDGVARQNGFTFIGGHPMAGTERSGFAAARAGLFQGASFILTPPPSADRDIIENLRQLILSIGFGEVVVTKPSAHDRMIAFTSQLPHVLACAYVESPCCPGHRGFSSGSFRDVSRVAHINSELWPDLFIYNSAELCAEIDTLINNISEIRDAVADGDRKKLKEIMDRARRIKDGV